MHNAAYLCPLLAATGQSRSPAAPPTATTTRVLPVAVDAAAPTAAAVDAERLGALLRATRSDLIENEMAMTQQAGEPPLPPWAQRILDCRASGDRGDGERLAPKRPLSNPAHGGGSGSSAMKRPRGLSRKDHLRLYTEDEEGGFGSSQDTDPGDDDARPLFTHEERVAEHVEKYSGLLERLLEDVRARQEHRPEQDAAMDLFAAPEVKTLVQSLKVMDKNAIITRCDPQLLITLMDALDRQVQIGLALDVLGTLNLDDGDAEWQASGIDVRLIARIQASLDIGICELLVMATVDIDRRVLSEEIIDNCIQLLSNCIQRLVLPCIDPASANSVSVTRVGSHAATLVSPQSERGQSSSGGRRRSKGSSSSSSFNVKTNKEVKRAIDRLLPVVCEFLETLARLIMTVKLADRWILHFSAMTTRLFLLEGSSHATVLQRSGLQVLRAVFIQYPTHRSLILDEIVSVMLKLPTSKRGLRTVKLVGSNSSVQMITTVIVSLVQCCVSDAMKAPEKSQDPTLLPETVSSADRFRSRLNDSRESARLFINALLKECLKKNEERDYRVVLENFVEDLLELFSRPEWGGAEVLLEMLSSSLAGILGANLSKDAKKVEAQYSLTALHLVGRLCAAIRMHQNLANRDTMDDEEMQLVLRDHEKFVFQHYTSVKDEGTECEADIVCEERMRSIVLKQIVLSHLRRYHHDSTYDDARRIQIIRFILDENDSSIGNAYWEGQWETCGIGQVDSVAKITPPSQDVGLRIGLQLCINRDFCKLFDKLLMHLMALLSRGIPTFRARVMKALAGIVDVDPMLMAESGVRATVCRCFLDEATSVRQAAVDLVGKYVTLQPLLFDRYCDMLGDRLRDKGISVRKSVCKILRLYLTSPSSEIEDSTEKEENLKRRSSCLRRLVERIGDPAEEDIVKNFIIDTFQEVWFGSDLTSRQLTTAFGFDDVATHNGDASDVPPGWSVVDSSAVDDDYNGSSSKNNYQSKRQSLEYISPDGKVVTSVEEAWASYRTPLITPSSLVKSKRSKQDDAQSTVCTIIEVIHDMSNMDWFVALLKRLLFEDPSKQASNRRTSRDRSEDISIARSRSEKIVGCLIESIVRLEEGHELDGVIVSTWEAQYLSCVKALTAFSEASPLLLLPHLEYLLLNLKGDEKFSKATEAKIQSLVVSIVGNVITHSERITDRVANRLETDLKDLILRSPPSVVGPSIKCLATLTTHTKRPPVLLFKLLESFYGYLERFKNVKSLATLKAEAVPSLQRALFAAGQIGGAIDLDKCDHDLPVSKALQKFTIMESLYDMYSAYVNIPGNSACTAKSVQGLGFLFMLRPRFMLQTQQAGIFDTLLQSSSNEVKLQCLTSLKLVLMNEERRLEKGVAKKKMNREKSKKQQVQGDQEGEASLIGGVMQAQLKNVLVLALDKQVRIRSEAMSCVAVLLTQGLVSPLLCVPTMVALETDRVVSIRDAAHSQLLALYEKSPSMLHTPSIEGIFLSHSFQSKVFGKCDVFAMDKEKKEYCLYGRLYSNCLRPARSQRNMFLKSLVNQFSDKGSILSLKNLQSHPLKTADYLAYLARLVASLPYDVEDEPLYIIYLINRYVTLKLGPMMQNLRKEFARLGVAPREMMSDESDLAAIDLTPFLASVPDHTAETKDLLAKCCVAFAIKLLLQVKFHLKDLYNLNNEKCQTYQPGSATKASDQPVLVADVTPNLEFPDVLDMQSDHSLSLSWMLMLHTWEASQEDQLQLDFDVQEDPNRSKKRKGRRKRVVAKPTLVDDEDEEFVEGFNG